MKCAKCEMVNQIPGTNCAHCGRPIPHPEPIVTDTPEPVDATPFTEEAAAEEAPAQAEEAQEEQAIEPESGHVDNVGDESETETVTG
ncbi:MAG: hypothetical protein GTO41_01500 [Burkholderiales bacterium]|nr:hypothetical protein [Burkholderiales bacterium]